jgi:hypothetical protein
LIRANIYTSSKVYEVDPPECPKCGAPMRVMPELLNEDNASTEFALLLRLE